jgi:hypothetical protein
MSKNYPSEREPARIVKCPYCEHKGSARGLFSHIRLSHPKQVDISRKLVSEKRSHPCDIKKGKIGGFTTTKRKSFISPELDSILTIIGVVLSVYQKQQSLSRGGYKSPSETYNELEKLKPEIVRTLGSLR